MLETIEAVVCGVAAFKAVEKTQNAFNALNQVNDDWADSYASAALTGLVQGVIMGTVAIGAVMVAHTAFGGVVRKLHVL